MKLNSPVRKRQRLRSRLPSNQTHLISLKSRTSSDSELDAQVLSPSHSLKNTI